MSFGDADPIQPLQGRPPIAGLLIRRSQQAHTTMWSLCVPSQVTRPQWAILRVLHEGERVDQTSLGHLAALDRSNTAEVLARLKKRGLVESSRAETDRRRKVWTLTATGQDLYRRVLPAAVVANELLLAGLGPTDRAQFLRLLQTVVAAERCIEDRQAQNVRCV